MANGEKIRRSWLMYSVQKDAIFCFCCKLFGTGDIPLRCGTSAWKALSKRLQQHETGKGHQDCMVKWFDLRSGIVNHTSIDQLELQAFLKERDFWRNVVKRMVDVVIFLSERNLAFRGSNEKLGDPSNGNFLGLFELLAKYDTVLSKLLQRIKKAETHVQYLSPQIQNELIQLVASNIQEANIAQLKKAKYYSVILDCTPNVSHEEQTSVVLCCVECNGEDGVNIREAFVGFLNVHDTTGEGLLEAFLEKTNNLGIDIADMRGQAYDNGANIRGKNKGVQARMLEINDHALYVPCGAHTWNLVISDAATSSKYAVDFFGLINRIYVIFSSSPSCWDILQEHMPISVKGLSDTRWESRIDAVKPLHYHLEELYNALSSLREYALKKKDGNTATKAGALLDHVTTWPFVLTVYTWYDILFHVNKTSKLIQSPDVSIDVLQAEVGATKKFLEDYRNTGYISVVTNAREIAEHMGIEQVFPETRVRRKKRMFDYECADDLSRLSAEEKFKSQFFLVLTDQAMSSVSSRFDQLVEWYKLVGFLYNTNSLKQCHRENELENHSKNFERKMGDIDANELILELICFIYVIEKERGLVTASNFLTYIYKNSLQEIYPNLCICIRILLTTPVTVAGAERSFSRMKLIKNILRSTMTDDRFSALAVISIENKIARSLDYDALINQFAENKARKKRFA
nr:zinc finger MYM-type protein 1-like [Chrysemys picta bellii]